MNGDRITADPFDGDQAEPQCYSPFRQQKNESSILPHENNYCETHVKLNPLMVKQYPPDKVNEEAALPQVNKETVGLPVKVVVSQQQHGKKAFTQQQQLKEVNLQEQENNKTVGTALEKEAVDQSQLIKHANEQPQLEKEAPSQPIIKENLVPKENSDEITLVKTVRAFH